MLRTILLICFAILAQARFQWGPCPAVEVQQNFNLEKYTGTWYEKIRSKSIPYEGGKCTKQYFESIPESDHVKLNFTGITNSGKYAEMPGEAYCEDGTGQCYIKLGDFPYGDYKVISTDYKDYAVVYICKNFYLFHHDYMYFSTRHQRAEVGDYDLQEFLDELDYEEDELFYTEQRNCSV